KSNRIQSIDLLRGLVMVIMALDHVRDYTNHGYLFGNPTDIDITTPLLFFTRWITHFCAPVFVFLAGTSAYLDGSRKTKEQAARCLHRRGLGLILVGVTVVNVAWTFDICLGVHIFQVIWAIGLSMVLVSAFIFVAVKYLLILGILLAGAHNVL